MRKSNTKTSLRITLNPDGSALTNLKWSDIDIDHHREASERLLAALTNVRDYDWLFDILQPLLHGKYCAKCVHLDLTKPCEDGDYIQPFPYCFVKKWLEAHRY